jgi:hypothetical protein
VEPLVSLKPAAPAYDASAIRCGEDTNETAVAASTSRAYPVGATLGSYRLIEQIGAGGMGRVFIAEHVRLGRKVALKVLRSEYSGNIEAVKRFFAEARAVNCINHENIIEVSDFIENAKGPSFYIMELLRGTELRALEDREGPLPLRRALAIALQVCRGVGAAHAAGVIHRDLKPDNIFLIERDGRQDFVKLLDFGVAKLSNTSLDEASMFQTSIGIVVGTPNYMAPEQAFGRAVDHRVDVYSLGVVLFEMVAGRRPFVGRTAREVMVQHMMAPPPRPSQLNPTHDLPSDLEDLILECLRKEPEERPATIKEVERRLQEILDRVVSGRAAQEARSASRALRRSNRWLTAAGVVTLLLCTGVFAWSRGLRAALQVAHAGVLEHVARAPARAEVRPPSPARRELTTESFPRAPGGVPAPRSEIASRAATETERAPDAIAQTAATASASRPEHAPAPPPRRKPAKLDRDTVLNPFE